MTSKTIEALTVAMTGFDNLAQGGFGVIEVATKGELAQSEIDALAVETKALKDIKKTVSELADERVEEIKKVFFDVANAQVGAEQPFTLYSPEHGYKLVREITHSGGGVSADALLKGLYVHFGEEYGDTEGRAWAVWCKVTDPVQTRVINEGKLAAEIEKSIEAANGVKHGSTINYVPLDVVTAAEIPQKIGERFCPKDMTKDERKAYAANELA